MAKQANTTNIIALGFESLDGAENMLPNVHVWQDKGYFTVKDAVVVTKGAGANKLEIKQTVKKTGKWALGGGGIGFLAGMLLGGPVGGLIVGATVGAISGALKDSGIDDNFIQVVGTSLADTSALLIMVEPNPNRDEQEMMKELSEQRATVLSTTLAPDREKQLKSLLSGHGTPAAKSAPVVADAAAEPTETGLEEIDPEVVTEGGDVVAEASVDDSADAEGETVPEAGSEVTPEAAVEPDSSTDAKTPV